MRHLKFLKLSMLFAAMVFAVFFLNSCGLVKGLKLLKSKEINPVYYNTATRNIILVPNTHFGQPEFYADLTDSIHHWKNQGYRIYYEMVTTDITDPKYELNERKWRKITGGNMEGTPEEYEAALQGVYKKGIGQPEYETLGITEDDLNADIDFNDFMDKFEELYGEIVLDSCDLFTPLDSAYTCKGIKGARSTINYLMIDYRNENVVKTIEENKDPKIVVVYGMYHIKGILKLLKNSNI